MNIDRALEIAEDWRYEEGAPGARLIVTLADEVKRLHTWPGLMSLLDEHYPADVMTGESGDLGPRIAALVRELERLRAEVKRLREVLAGQAPAEGSWQAEALALRTELEQLRARDRAAKAVVQEWKRYGIDHADSMWPVLDALARAHQDGGQA